MPKRKRDRSGINGPVLWRRLGTVLVITLPLLLFLPGIGFDTSHPASLARQSQAHKTWLYKVQPQDILGKIAQRELGSARRYDEIIELNPGIKPRELPVGSVLRMPPREAQAVGAPAAPAPVATTSGQSPRRLLLAFAALLALVVLVVAIASKLERTAHRA